MFPIIKYHYNPSSGSRSDKFGWTHVTKLIGAFRDYVRTRLKRWRDNERKTEELKTE